MEAFESDGASELRNARKFLGSNGFKQNNNVDRVVVLCLVPSMPPYREHRWTTSRVLCHSNPVSGDRVLTGVKFGILCSGAHVEMALEVCGYTRTRGFNRTRPVPRGLGADRVRLSRVGLGTDRAITVTGIHGVAVCLCITMSQLRIIMHRGLSKIYYCYRLTGTSTIHNRNRRCLV